MFLIYSLGGSGADQEGCESIRADYMQGTHVKFNSKQEAIAFCEKQGWEFYVQEPNVQKFVTKSYAK